MPDQACEYCSLPIPRRLRRDALPGEPGYCCYGCRFAAEITKARGEKAQATWMLTRLGCAAFFSMAVMVLSVYLYGEQIGRDETSVSPVSANLTAFVKYASLLLSLPVLVLLGYPIARNAAEQWRNGIVAMDGLVVLGAVAAFVYSYASTLRGVGHTYYETACAILVLVTLGRWLEASGRLQASEAVHALETLLPDEVTVMRGKRQECVPVEQLREADIVLVTPGMRIVVDGTIEAGRANIDQQIVTGEYEPVVKQTGDKVSAGSLNLDGTLKIRAAAVGVDSTVGRLARILQDAQREKGRYQRLSDRVTIAAMPVIGCLAACAAGLGFARGGLDEALLSMLAVLLVACPCALGIATPLAVWMALGTAAKAGVLCRNAEAIEKLAKVRTFCFDKTGTLTTGAPLVASFSTTRSLSHAQSVLSVAAGLAELSAHVAGKCIAAFARLQGVEPAPISNVRAIPGRGLIGTAPFGETLFGNVSLMRENGIAVDQNVLEAERESGHGITCVGWDGDVRGVFAISEMFRDGAHEAVQSLQASGFEVFVLTGDNVGRGREIERSLGAKVIPELLPEDKVGHVDRLRPHDGLVAMIGDGLNDAQALAVADVGIAMGCGADLTRESADVCMLGTNLRAIPWLHTLAKRTAAVVRQNLAWAFGYNLIGMGLAVFGKLNPIVAAAAMVASNLLVVSNSMRLGQANREEPR